MKLVLLGTGGYHPNDRRHTLSVMAPEQGIVLDAGTAFYRVGRYAVGGELDVLLTHAHLDHVFGLTFLFNVLREHPMRRVTVHARPEVIEAVDRHLLASAVFPVKLPCEYRPIEGCITLAGGAEVRSFPVEHPGGAVGYRLQVGRHSVAYVTDTTAGPEVAYLDAIREADVLVHECYYPDEHAELAARYGHSHASAVADLARRAEVGLLVLVHVDPARTDDDPVGLASIQAVFPQTVLGEDLMEIEI